MDLSILTMLVLGIPLWVLIIGGLAFLWKFRDTITRATSTKIDDKVVDTVEGIAEHLDIDVDFLAAKSRGRLVKVIKERWL